MSLVRRSNVEVVDSFSDYKVSECLRPFKQNLSDEEIAEMMNDAPNEFFYVDFLGSIYLMQMPKDSSDHPELIAVEGAHFVNLLQKKYWFAAENYFWDKLAWVATNEKEY